MEVNPDHVRAFETPDALAAWLASYHDGATELWLQIFKTGSGIASVTWAEAVVEALRWGWIDGLKKSGDERFYFQRFTPRRPGSAWSRKNRDHAEALIRAGRMEPPGLAEVAAARADGRWDAAYAGSAAMSFPDDFLAMLSADPAAAATFAALNRANRYAIAYRLQTARTPQTRQARMDRILAMLARGETFH